MVHQINKKKPLDCFDGEFFLESESIIEDNESLSEVETTLDDEDSFWDNFPEVCSFCRLFCNNLEMKAKVLLCNNIICKVK